MSEQELKEFQDRFDLIVQNAQKYAIFVRGIEFQVKQIEALNLYQKEIISKKEQAIQEGDEIAANTLLSLECMNIALIKELEMLVYLKQDQTNEAWDALISAEMAISAAIRAHPSGGANLNNYVKKLTLYEKLLFPNQIFFSTGIISKYSECSICGKEYGTCEHLIGKPYMGKLCAEIIKDVDLKEVSIVREPADKKCRAYTISEGESSIDYLTLRVVE